MTTDYEALYADTPEALGQPSYDLINAINACVDKGGHVLDVGCGQGRDALSLAWFGRKVTGVDNAPSGIRDMRAAAEKDGYEIEGIVADLRDWDPPGTYDALLCDRTLHMLDEADRLKVFARLIGAVAEGGYVFVVDEGPNIPDLMQVLIDSGRISRTLVAQKGELYVKLDK